MPGFEAMIQPPAVGRVLAGRYRLVAPIARGGMAEVWEAHDEVLSRPVAAKVLQAHLAADAVFLERFRREAVTAARLAHPGIVATFDTGYDQGTAFIVMELVKGRNLRQWLDTFGRMDPGQAVGVARQVADALSYAHQAGLVHRDVKPANILLIEDEWGGLRVKVTDFGIAKAGMETGGDLTRTGIVLGTPKYLSPEQLRGGDPDPRADLYSVGVVLYETLVGTPPYVGDNDMATALAHLGDRVPKPSASVRGIPGGLDKVVVDLLAKTPERRIQSGLELRRRLDALGVLAAPAGGPAGRHRVRRRQDQDLSPPEGWGRPAGANGNGSSPNGVRPGPAPAAPAPTRVNGVGPGPVVGTGAVAPTAAIGRPDGAWRAPGATNGTNGFAARPGGPAGPTRVVPVAPPRGPGTDEFVAARTGYHRSGRTTGIVVVVLIVVAAAVAAGLLLTTGSGGHSSKGGPSVATGHVVPIGSVSVYMDNDRPPDNPGQTPYTFDGNPATVWTTDRYASATFGDLYDGIGLEISLKSAAKLENLAVTSSTSDWSASVYVSSTAVPSGQPVSTWGPVASQQSGINGDANFSLGGRQGAYVLLWITYLGPTYQASVAELSVTG